MPSGYTAEVADGTITDFETYAMQCARAFGACIELRDEPLSPEIPEFEPSQYHAKKLDDAQIALAQFEVMTREQRIREYEDWCQKTTDDANEGIARKKQIRERYEAMLEKAKAFVPPSPEHEGYAAFLVKQLEESIDWDCDPKYWREQLALPLFEDWEKDRLESLKRDIEYHTEQQAEEDKRTQSRNEWVRKLKETLAQPVG